MSDHTGTAVTRRTFLQTSGAVLGLAAAAPVGAPPAAHAQGAKTVKAIVQASWAELGMRDATAAYNAQMKGKGIQVELEDTATGWEQKALAMIKDKSLPWSAHGYAPAFNQYSYIKSGLAAPIDEWVKNSPVPWAKDMKSTYYAPNIDAVNRHDRGWSATPVLPPPPPGSQRRPNA